MPISEESLNTLWGAVLGSPVIDLETGSVDFKVKLPDREYVLRFGGLMEFSIKTKSHSEWDYTELTGIEMKSSNGQIFVTMEVWSGAASILITCRDAQLQTSR